jgi:hypothetical protein
MSKHLTTEQLMIKCFEFDQPNSYTIKFYARAARRFVRLEQRQKLFKELDRIHAIVKKDHPEFVPTKLPKHWGELK